MVNKLNSDIQVITRWIRGLSMQRNVKLELWFLVSLLLMTMMVERAHAQEPPPSESPPASPVPTEQPTSPKNLVEEPKPFAQGAMNLGLIFGISAGQTTSITLGGAFGYYVLNGLEPGLELEVIFGSDRNTVTSLLPYLRWIIWRSYSFSPFLKVQGGRWFISNEDDLTVLGGGGGAVMFLSRMAGLVLEGMVYRLFPESGCGDNCTLPSFGLTLGFFLGGR